MYMSFSNAHANKTKHAHKCMCRIHPHHHGSASNQVPTASFPAIIEHNPEGGFDFLSPSSCAWAKSLLASAPEIILHFQVLLSNKHADKSKLVS